MTEQTKLTFEESQKYRDLLGEKFIINLYRFTIAIKLYESNNAVLIDCARELIDIVSNWVLKDGYLNIESQEVISFCRRKSLFSTVKTSALSEKR